MTDNSKNSTQEPFDDEVDEDLLALSPPPPSPRFLIFTLAILILSVVMLGWFEPELRFFLAAFGGADDLGEAADIDAHTLSSHSYVSLEGFPLIQRTLSFKEGVKWFMLSDNTRKFFPLAGQPYIFVQWAESDAHKAYRDPEHNPGVMGPPSHFKGQLVSRKDLGKSYQRVFVFYDCLKYHYLGRCNQCLGKPTLDACRDAFVCAENNEKAVCDALGGRSLSSIETELAAAKGSGDAVKRQSLEKLRAAKRALDVSERSVRLEELIERASRLVDMATAEKSALKGTLQKEEGNLFGMRIKELSIRAQNAVRTVESLGEGKVREIRNEMARLDGLREKVSADTATLKLMDIFIDIGDELERLRKRCLDLEKKAVLLTPAELAAHSKFDPESKDGVSINNAIAALESLVADKERARYAAAHPTSDTEGAETKTDAGVAKNAAPPSPPLPDVTETLRENPDYQRLIKALDTVSGRAAAVVAKIRVLMPGMAPAFDKWAAKPDVLGIIPEGLREVRVVGALGEIEKMLQKVAVPEGDAPLLAAAYNKRLDALNAAKKGIETIENMPGVKEIRIVDQLNAIKGADPKQAEDLKMRIDALVTEMTSAGLYLANLNGAPDATAALDKLLAPAKLTAVDATLDTAEAALSPGEWVLIDGEIPMDKLWVPVVYLILFVMIFINLRKLWHFYIAYKE